MATQISEPASMNRGRRMFDARRSIVAVPAHAASPFVETEAFRRILTSQAKLIVIAAPPGFGKTALLRAVADRLGAGADVVDWAKPAEVQALLAERSSTGGQGRVLMIDDGQEGDARQLPHILARIAGSDCPGTIARCILATRTLPDMDWLSWELTGQVLLLRLGDLVTTPSETQAIIELYADSTASVDQGRQVHDLVEGWPIAAQLCGLMARREGGWRSVATGQLRPRADLDRYLNERVFAGLDDVMRGFLLQLAEFDRFSGPMLETVLGNSAVALLNRALTENTMLLPARGNSQWWRLHGIFRDFLIEQKRRGGRVTDNVMLMHASSWCAKHGASGDAIDYALRAGRPDEAQALLLGLLPAIVYQDGELPRILG